MSNKTFVYMSLGASLVSLAVSICVLVNYCPTQNLRFDYMGVIVGILALLVTALVGAQVGQYVFVDRKIERITSNIARKISRNVSQNEARDVAQKIAEEVAKNTAQTVAMRVVGGLPDDIAYVLRGKDWIQNSASEIMAGEFMTAIDYCFKALQEFKHCGAEVIYQSTIDDALETMKNYFDWCRNRGGLRILIGQRSLYESILSDIRSEKLQVCRNYVAQAKEMEKDEDNRLSQQEFEETFNL